MRQKNVPIDQMAANDKLAALTYLRGRSVDDSMSESQQVMIFVIPASDHAAHRDASPDRLIQHEIVALKQSCNVSDEVSNERKRRNPSRLVETCVTTR